MQHVLFVCTHNAGRSQMAESLFSQAAAGRHSAASAGTAPADRVHPEVIEVMRELGIDLAGRVPQPLTAELAQRADVVVTMGCGDQCPYIPGKRYVDWELEDPKGRPIDEVRATREEIARRVAELLAELDQTGAPGSPAVTLKPWGSHDFPLLTQLMGDPLMTEHLGGPESPEKLRERQGRYERLKGGDRMFKIVEVASGAGVGSVGYWKKEWREDQVYEVGWMVVPAFQGRGIAAAATAQAIALARREEKYRFMHAFPNVENAPSNAICRKLGFELLEALEFEFPKGHFMTCNDWRLDLRAPSA